MLLDTMAEPELIANAILHEFVGHCCLVFDITS